MPLEDDDGFEPIGQVARRVVEDLDWRMRLACEHPETQIRRKSMSDGRPMFKLQCVNCGRGVGTAIGARNVPDTSVEWDQKAEDAYDASWIEQRKDGDSVIAARLAEIDERRSLWWTKYDIYLQSDEWMARRRKALERDKHLCQSCREAGASQVHHLTYAHAFNEPLFDLISVCKSCHDRLTHIDRCARDGYRYEETIKEW